MCTWYNQLLEAINEGRDLPLISDQDNSDDFENEILSVEIGNFSEK